MAENCVHTDRTPDEVFDHLLDPWCYPDWLLGASTMRAVDDGWPSVGSAFHHRVGWGPLKVDDRSEIIELDRPRRLVLHVRATPLVQGVVTFTVEPTAEGSVVRLQEEPAVRIGQILSPVLDPVTHIRNRSSLRNLADLMRRNHERSASGR